MEEWKQCLESLQRVYFVSNLGRMKSVSKFNKREKIMKERISKGGYIQMNINNKDYKVHILVALYFIGPRPDGMVIDHKDRNKLNNRVDNLRYCSISDNCRNRCNFREDILVDDIKERRLIIGRESHSRKYTCICGLTLRTDSKQRHEKRRSHQAYLNSL